MMKANWQQILCLAILTQSLLVRIIQRNDGPGHLASRILSSKEGDRGLQNINSEEAPQRSAPMDQTIVVGKKLSKLEKRLKFMEMVKKILSQSKTKNLKIESIKIGAHIKKIFGIKSISTYLSKLVGDANLDQKIDSLKTKIGEIKQAKVLQKRKLRIRKPIQSEVHSSGRALRKKEFVPGFAGMPFPPFMMNGPHFHPPMNITINSIPNPVARGQFNPFELEQLNLSNQLQQMARLKEGLDDLDSTLSVVSAKVKLGMNDKYSRLQQINE